MPSKSNEKADYAKYVIRNNPSATNTDLAKRLISDRPDLFHSEENARNMIRYYVGKMGNTHRKYVSETDMFKPDVRSNAKILLFDLETAPLIAYTWSKWPKSISDDMIIQDWFILTWSAKWLFDDKVYQAKVTSKEAKNADDKRITQGLWKMIDEADIIIAHNLAKFDRKKANTRFLKHDLGLPSPYQMIDTLLHCRRQFGITSNRLDYIAQQFFGISGKMETERGLWWRAVSGEAKAIKQMADYCDQDVRVLEDVYLKIRPYIQPHPNIGLLTQSNKTVCTHCGSEDLHYIGEYSTYVNQYDAYRCGSCKGISRSRKTNTPIAGKKHLNVSTPR